MCVCAVWWHCNRFSHLTLKLVWDLLHRKWFHVCIAIQNTRICHYIEDCYYCLSASLFFVSFCLDSIQFYSFCLFSFLFSSHQFYFLVVHIKNYDILLFNTRITTKYYINIYVRSQSSFNFCVRLHSIFIFCSILFSIHFIPLSFVHIWFWPFLSKDHMSIWFSWRL